MAVCFDQPLIVSSDLIKEADLCEKFGTTGNNSINCYWVEKCILVNG